MTKVYYEVYLTPSNVITTTSYAEAVDYKAKGYKVIKKYKTIYSL